MKKRTLSWEMQGQTLHLHSFSFPPSFPDGRGFGSARRGQYAARAKQPTIRAGRSHLPCGDRWQAPCGQTDVKYLMRWQTAKRDASQIVCLLRIGLPAPLCNVAQGRRYIQARRKPGTDVPMTKASGGRPVRQARKEVSKNGKGRVPKKISKRQANAESH